MLAAEAVAVGLNEAESRALLEDGRYADLVRQEQQQWLARGVRAVPTLVFNLRYAVSGAQEAELLAEVLRDSA